LRLAAVAIAHGEEGIDVCVDAVTSGEDESATPVNQVAARWWCRSAADAARIAAAAKARLDRHGPPSCDLPEGAGSCGRAEDSRELAVASASVAAAANRLGIALSSDDEIAQEAGTIAARVDAELQRMHACGGLKSINGAYRSYRLEAQGRGEAALRYDEWMSNFREKLIRQVAAMLRSL
jgi:hypothetical protein